MVSFDSGPRFRATHVRLEGDDPISLSILLDGTGPEDALLPKIDAAIAALAPLSLHSQDHVSIYALDCSLSQTLGDAPAEQSKLKQGVDSALESWTYRKKNKHAPHCQQSIHLWDALALITEDLYPLPGRHVVLAITDGSDRGSVQTWNEVKFFAQSTGVAIFGMTYASLSAGPFRSRASENAFNSVCELSGGMIFMADTEDAAQTLQRFMKTIRERYIVEFPRPFNSTVGPHDFLVTIEKMDAFIRPAGISVPIADPTTVPSDPSRAPMEGTRRVLTKPQ
jgi:hypothetical protein